MSSKEKCAIQEVPSEETKRCWDQNQKSDGEEKEQQEQWPGYRTHSLPRSFDFLNRNRNRNQHFVILKVKF